MHLTPVSEVPGYHRCLAFSRILCDTFTKIPAFASIQMGECIVACLEKVSGSISFATAVSFFPPRGPLKFHLGEKSFNAQWNRERLLQLFVGFTQDS